MSRILKDYGKSIRNRLLNVAKEDNVEMKTRWTAFLKKIAVKKDLQFSEVVKYLQSILRPYWESLNPMHESVGK